MSWRNCEKRLTASSCPSVCWHRTNRLPLDGFSHNLNLKSFRKSVEKIRLSLNTTRVTDTLHEDLCKFVTTPRYIFLRMRNISNKICRENQNIQLVLDFFFFENYALYEMMRQNMVQPDATEDITPRVRFAC